MPKKTNSPSKKEEETAKEEVKKINSIHILALWKGFSPDVRPYKPSTPQIEFLDPLQIVVNVPLTNDLIDNASVISLAQLANQTEPNPIFTPLGMRYIIDQFEAVMQNGEPEQEETAKDDEDWGDETEEEKKKTAKASDDEEWEDEDKASKDKEEEDKPWEEDWEE